MTGDMLRVGEIVGVMPSHAWIAHPRPQYSGQPLPQRERCTSSGLVVFVDSLDRVHLVLSLDGALRYFFDRHVFYDV